MVNLHGTLIQSAHESRQDPYATQQRQRSSSHAISPKGGGAPGDSARADIRVITLPISLPDPWPLAKITIDMEKPSQWVSKALTDCRWWFESLLVHSGVSSATRRKATGADQKKNSQWVSKMCRLYFADEYVRRTVGVPTTAQVPDMEPALKAVQNILPKLEARIIEFLSEWLVTFLMPAKHVLDTRAPHLYFMFLKEYWFRELYLGLKVTASFDRSE